MWIRPHLTLCLTLALAACGRGAEERRDTFPDPQRPVAPIVSSRYLNEDARDSVSEAERVMELANIGANMYVADIGAGEGYYTVRLSPLVGERGRVLAQDIVPETIHELARRVHRERLDNVALKLGQPNNPLLPEASFDRVLMIHMYHEIQRPAEFLWHLRTSLKRDGRVVVVPPEEIMIPPADGDPPAPQG